MSVDDRLASILAAEQRIKSMLDRELKGGTGGGTSGGMTEDWKSGVDAQLAQLHSDVRKLLVALVAGFLFLLAAAAAAYVKISDQVNANAVALAALGGKAEVLDTKLDMLVDRTKPKR